MRSFGGVSVAQCHPHWWHPHGNKMNVQTSEDEGVVIESRAARLTITRGLQNGDWNIGWEISHFDGGVTSGRMTITSDKLSQMFDLSPCNIKEEDTWITAKYGADFAIQGKCIRRKDCLNIPCPGTGNDGDPNLSIELDDKIQEAVRKLLS